MTTRCILAGLLVVASKSLSQVPQADVPRVSLVSQFNVSGILGDEMAPHVVVHAAIAHGRSLYFLISSSPTTRDSVLVKTDLYGRVERATPLGRNEVIDFVVDDSDRIVIRMTSLPPARNDVLRTMDAGGNWIGQPVEVGWFGRMATLNSSLIGVSSSGTVVRLATRQLAFPGVFSVKPLKRVDAVLRLSSSKVAAVDRVRGELQLIDTENQTAQTMALDVPEIEEARLRYPASALPRGTAALLVQAVTADELGRLYVMCSGFTREQGMPVAVLDSQGKVLMRLRLEVGRTPDGKLVIPAVIAAAAGSLYISDARGQISVYPIPDFKGQP